MPRDPKRNLQRYQLQGGHLNQFEFQKSRTEMAEEADLPFTDQTGQSGLTQAERVAAVIADAHRKVKKRKKTEIAKAGGNQNIARGKSSPRKGTRKSAKKRLTRSGTQKQSKRNGVGKKLSQSVAKTSKKTTKQASKKKGRNDTRRSVASR
jgi:hypothetical protein